MRPTPCPRAYRWAQGAVAAALLLVLAATGAAAPRTPVRFETVARGAASQIRAPRQVVVRDARGWAALWREHAGPEAAIPSVDFDQAMVVGIFAGEVPAETTLEIRRIAQEGFRITVFYTQVSPAPAGNAPPITPFHLARLARSQLLVRFERLRSAERERTRPSPSPTPAP